VELWSQVDVADFVGGPKLSYISTSWQPGGVAPLFDCNTNGILDSQDIASGFSMDDNGNGIPDECDPQADCNSNGIEDADDLASGFSLDANGNGIPDECDGPGPGSGGDPHFLRWGHTRRDSFHGECDLILIRSKTADMAIHIRTTMVETYSFIEQIGIRLGQDILLDFHRDTFFLNGREETEDITTGDFSITLIQANKYKID
jgi:hypothetical protein